jgi:hypothetical protein
MTFPARLLYDFTPHFHEPDAPDGWRVTARVELGPDAFTVTVIGPLTEMPPPPHPPGRVEALWRHDVIEVFLLGDDDRYLELELGSHGHFWLLSLNGCRNIVGELAPLHHAWRHDGGRFEASVRLPAAALPPGLSAINVTCILGQERFHGSLVPLPGERPDFHQLARFHFPG